MVSARLSATLAVVSLLLAGCGGSARASASSCGAKLASVHARGEFAFVRNGGVSIVRLPSCRTHVLTALSDARGPLRFSADGAYLAYGDGEVIAARGTPAPQRPLGRLVSWAWAPSGASLAGVATNGAVLLGGPDAKPRTVLPPSAHAATVAFTPNGRTLIVTLAAAHGVFAGRPQTILAVSLPTRRRTVLARVHHSALFEGGIAGVTPNGRYVLYWPNLAGSASIAADGLPLDAVPVTGGPSRTLVHTMLAYPDYLAACGVRLLVTAGGLRETDFAKTLVSLAPPAFQPQSLHLSRALSATNASCSRAGAIAVAAGRSSHQPRFGLQHRSIWLLPRHGAPYSLTTPAGASVSDELPRIAANGRYVLFVRMAVGRNGAGSGQLELATVPRHRSRPAVTPIADIGGAGIGYYDHYGWALSTAWHEG